MGELIIFEPWRKKLSFLPAENFLYTATLYTFSIYLSTSKLLSLIISNTDKYEFSSILK